MRVIGMMSGTSYDAVDAAAADLTLDGDTLVLTPLGMVSAPYPGELRAALAAALPPARTTMREVCRLDTRIGQAFASLAVRADEELCEGRADLITSHGQTVYHWSENGSVHGTLQLGDPAWIAEATGRAVVSGLRGRDVAAGGQGAPLVALVDVLWLRGRPGRPVALNLGGIANITAAGRAGPPAAFDTGPGNALIDAAVRHFTGGRLAYDEDGALAARGRVDEALLRRLLDDPYYAQPPPRTTGKELFHLPYLLAALAGHETLPAEDVVATVTRLTAVTVADAARSVRATEVIASGGGTRNPALMAMLRGELGGIPLYGSDDLGLPPAAKEAYAFAVLGFLTVHGIAGTVAACTGARHASVLGSLTPGREGLRLPEPAAVAPVRLRVAGRPGGGREM
ncbi:anhydro-N-acetylmuramic acid kinase [Streptomyces ficellus]|uniref:Anhydro-N-acetylmuramic acid kinase n=1 Tax=Streptomyces ficellus TaxID=1977088 RepID=A0ABT7ZDQ7_9ACTN|nr:anhydro-N-acetylmuramic acid kinase [Streptomyces ficellus]MDN3297565.1 anhydro-N-acetylmuramic acid kinase [Streptomyces ficellus]